MIDIDEAVRGFLTAPDNSARSLVRARLLQQLGAATPAECIEIARCAIERLARIIRENEAIRTSPRFRNSALVVAKLAVAHEQNAAQRAAQRYRTDTARKGAEANNARWFPVKKRACDLALAQPFPSRRNAAHSIAPAVIDFAKSRGLGLSASQAPKTIDGWLKEAGLTFAPRAKRT
jgi:hypothetical protein